MNKLNRENSNDFKMEKLKILEWLWKYYDVENGERENVDVKEMSVISQLLGYKLESFQTLSHLKNVKDESKIEITCYNSGVRSVLVKQNDICKCPDNTVLEEGHFWVDGIEPAAAFGSQTSISTSNSSIIPKLSKSVTKIIRGLLSKVLELIANAENIDDTVAKHGPLLTRHNSLDPTEKKEMKILKRTSSFDVSSTRSPCTSTPIVEKMKLRNVSECDKCDIVAKNLLRINELVNESLKTVPDVNKTFALKPNISARISDIKPSEGPSVKNLQEVKVIKQSIVQKPPPRKKWLATPSKDFAGKGLLATATKGTKTSSTAINRIIKPGKILDSASKLPKKKTSGL